MPLLRSLRSERGFTLVEVLAAMTVMMVGTLAAMGLIDRANEVTATTKSREAATSLARELIESARAIPYDRLTASGLQTELAAQPGLADSQPGGQYTIVRRDVTFTITGSVCVLDDARDGRRSATGTGSFCTGSADSSVIAIDTDPEDYKRVSVTVAWQRSRVRRSVTQTGLVNNPGAAGAPAIRSLTVSAGGVALTGPVTNPAVTSLRINATTSEFAATVSWLRDGTVRTPAPTPTEAGRTAWVADWELDGVLDGAYVVAAEAFNHYGVSGPTRELTVQLNRFAPQAPGGVAGGRTRYGHVELEWTGNPERDIIGYEVRRGSAVVCPLAEVGMSTECRDDNPPPASEGDVIYTVFAHDRDASGAVRPGPGTSTTVIANNLPPYTPVNVRRGSNGATLTWSKPSPEDAGPADDSVRYYRIYRDGRTYAHRYARWHDTSSTVSWNDPDADGMSHTYWVTAVDSNYMESDFAGGVQVP